MSVSRPRLLTIGFNIYGTGLTRVMRTVMGRLSDRFEIDYLGIGYSEPVSEVSGVRMHPTNMGGGDVFAAFQALEMAQHDPPEVLFILHDLWMFSYYSRVLAPLRGTTRLIAYIPLDGNIVDAKIVLPLRGLDRVIVYTNWAADQIRQAIAEVVRRGEAEADEFPVIDVIFHGVEAATFAPHPELVAADFDPRARDNVKRAVFPELKDPESSFIVLNASRPAIRKRVDLTIDSFAQFVRAKPDNVKLCLHHAITEPETVDLLALIDNYNIRNRVIYNPLNPKGGAVSEADLARLYSACDVGINTAMGEGWGLISFEHACTGAAQVIPRHTACSALWDDSNAQMVEPVSWRVPEYSPFEMGEVDANGVSQALDQLYSDPTRVRDLSRAGSAYANQPEFRWAAIADQFAAIFGAEASSKP